MDFCQIKYFVTMARCLNFTDAANQLYISQPALSRQITAIEKELNMQLFIRGSRAIHLTPAGSYLLNAFSGLQKQYEDILGNLEQINAGFSGILKIGVLELMSTKNFLPGITSFLNTEYPNIKIDVQNRGYRGLIEGLYDGNLDVVVTMDFELENKKQFLYKKINVMSNYLVLPVNHPKADKENPTLADFKDDTFITLEDNETEAVTKLLKESCRKAGFEPKLKMAKNISTICLWLDAGIGITGFGSEHVMFANPNLKFIKVPEINDVVKVAVWKADNSNPALKLFVDHLPSFKQD
ncbi:MAG: LysR family transcriptional regulator [Clostridiales bacterium]|nr:LysR family transcriptional regulator [Clostridiales bacterium]